MGRRLADYELERAARDGRVSALEKVLDAVADVDVRSHDGLTALMEAAREAKELGREVGAARDRGRKAAL